MLRDKIAGALYGMAMGDAMGMPAELWSQRRAREFFGGKIKDFLDGPKENRVARTYQYGQFTDDTAHGLILIDSLAASGFIPDPRDIAVRLLEWAESVDAWKNLLLGPTSRVALANFRDGIRDPSVTDCALSNGSAMRIAPVGCLFAPDRKEELADYVLEITKVTHSSNVTIAGACMIAEGVSSALVHDDFTKVLEDILAIAPLGYDRGFDLYTPRLEERVKLAIKMADGCEKDEDAFLRQIYDVIGTGTGIIESVPAAIGIAYYAQDPVRAALLSANVGGDTDTIGAMATSICGAFKGAAAIDPHYITTLKKQNGVDFEGYIDKLVQGRAKLAAGRFSV